MKKQIKYLSFCFLAILCSCVPEYTRTETDSFAAIQKDTTYSYFVQNNQSNRDRGVVAPSTKILETTREFVVKDSVEVRNYPDFIRLGLFESIGLIAGKSENSTGLGMFGIHPNLGEIGDNLTGNKDSNNIFTGGIYRIGIIEDRLRLTRDMKNVTWGIHTFEAIVGNTKQGNSFYSGFVPYLRYRYFLSEEVPFTCITFSFGISPWGFIGQIAELADNTITASYKTWYVNPSVSLDVGSMGGVNLRAYIGTAAGFNDNALDSKGKKGAMVAIPYLGLGISLMDFLMLEKETEIDIQEQTNSAWEIGLVQGGLLNSGAKQSFLSAPFDTNSTPGFFKGFFGRVLNADLVLPIFDNRFFVGTSLLNLIATGKNEWGMGILPIRAGYIYDLYKKDLTVSPFAEYSAYPSTIFNIGSRITIRFTENYSASFLVGYTTGNSNVMDLLGGTLNDTFGKLGAFSNYYFGFTVNIFERIFRDRELQYFKKPSEK